MATEKFVMAVIRAARPTLRNDCDKIAFEVHACFLASGNVLNATGPSAETAFSSPSTDEVGIEHWNELQDSYTFVYINPEKGSKKVLVKCLVMKDKLLVSVLADSASEPVHLKIKFGDYAGANGGNYSHQFKNLDKLVQSINTKIISKLYGSSKPVSLQRGEGSRRAVYVSDFESFDYRVPQLPPAGLFSRTPVPPINPSRGSDIFPGAGGGMYPRRGGFRDGGMLIGPNDHRWFGRRWLGGDGEPGFPGVSPLVPPGARFDPYGPPGTPGFEPSRYARWLHGAQPDLEHRPGGSHFI